MLINPRVGRCLHFPQLGVGMRISPAKNLVLGFVINQAPRHHLGTSLPAALAPAHLASDAPQGPSGLPSLHVWSCVWVRASCASCGVSWWPSRNRIHGLRRGYRRPTASRLSRLHPDGGTLGTYLSRFSLDPSLDRTPN